MQYLVHCELFCTNRVFDTLGEVGAQLAIFVSCPPTSTVFKLASLITPLIHVLNNEMSANNLQTLV